MGQLTELGPYPSCSGRLFTFRELVLVYKQVLQILSINPCSKFMLTFDLNDFEEIKI